MKRAALALSLHGMCRGERLIVLPGLVRFYEI